jgi:hypothetical protein
MRRTKTALKGGRFCWVKEGKLYESYNPWFYFTSERLPSDLQKSTFSAFLKKPTEHTLSAPSVFSLFISLTEKGFCSLVTPSTSFGAISYVGYPSKRTEASGFFSFGCLFSRRFSLALHHRFALLLPPPLFFSLLSKLQRARSHVPVCSYDSHMQSLDRIRMQSSRLPYLPFS